MKNRTVLAIGWALQLAGLSSAFGGGRSDGDLDGSFYGDGVYEFDPLGSALDQEIHAVVEAPDGRLLVAGTRETLLGGGTLFWATLNGVSPASFCTLFPSFQTPAFGEVRAAAFDSDGRLLLAGSADYLGEGGREGIVVRVLWPACTLDATFADGGVFRTDAAGELRFRDLALDSEGRIVAVGGEADEALIVRLGPDGDPDLTFDGDGRIEIDAHRLESVAIRSGERIVAGTWAESGEGDAQFAIWGFGESGELDTGWAGDGRAEHWPLGDGIVTRLAVDSASGAVLALGGIVEETGQGFEGRLVRFDASGEVDTGFGIVDGIVDGGSCGLTYFSGLVLDGLGRILVAGTEAVGFSAQLVACRLLAIGQPDPTFGVDGVARLENGPGVARRGNAIALQAGKVVVGGATYQDDQWTGAVARFWSALLFADGFERGDETGWKQ